MTILAKFIIYYRGFFMRNITMIIGILIGSQNIGSAVDIYPPAANDLEITNRGVASRSRPTFKVGIPPETFAEGPQFRGPLKIGIEEGVPIAQYSALAARLIKSKISGTVDFSKLIEEATQGIDINNENYQLDISTGIRRIVNEYFDNVPIENTVEEELDEPREIKFWLEVNTIDVTPNTYTIVAPENKIKYKNGDKFTNFISNEVTYFRPI